MWKCRKCNEPVYFAERKQSLGFDWHPKCLRCEECGKRLNPGQHAEHKGVPYCHHPCYGALFGPQLFGHGTRNECHTSFGKVENRDGQIKRSHLENKLKSYNQFYEGRPGELKSREANGRLILEGVLRIYWGVTNVIHLKEEDDCPPSPSRNGIGADSDSDGESYSHWRDTSPNPSTPRLRLSLRTNRKNTDSSWQNSAPSTPCDNQDTSAPSTPTNTQSARSSVYVDTPPQSPKNGTLVGVSTWHDVKERNGNYSNVSTLQDRDETDSNSNDLYVERNGINPTLTNGNCNDISNTDEERSETPKKARTALRRRPGRRMDKTKLKRRCSINGHWYLRETSSFRPPHGSTCSIWASSLVTASEVVHLLLEKYKVDMDSKNFALYIVKDTGEQRRMRDEEYPLVTRVMLGPHEEVSKIFIMDCNTTQEISPQVADFLNLSTAECQAIIHKYNQEEKRQIQSLHRKYEDMRMYIERRLRELQRGL